MRFKHIVLCVNGGIMHRLRYDTESDADRLYVFRQIENICEMAYPPQNHVRIWSEDEQLVLNLRS